MEYSKQMKRPLELSCSSDLAAENEIRDPKAAKRPCNENAGEIEEFLALLDRIEAAEKCLKGEREFYRSNWTEREKCSTELEISANRTAKSGSASWRPSFEWEDFSNGTRLPDKGPRRVPTSDLASARASKEKAEGRAGPTGRHVNLPAAEGLDLNVESSPELPFSGGLQLFS